MRPDICQHLVHFTKATEAESAYTVLRRILSEGRLIGGSRFVRGGSRCVCFSEAPLGAIERGLINGDGFTRYSPFGLQFSKEWVFGLGGRPVIYGPEAEYSQIPESLRWRHVRLELGPEHVDFTWEREWRLPSDSLKFSHQDISVVLPDDESRAQLIREIESDSFYTAWAYTQVLGDCAWAYDDGCPWKTVTLRRVEPCAHPNAGISAGSAD
jgi:NADH:ubiquinone oxidoreductase subunit